MILTIKNEHTYILDEASKIATESGFLYRAIDQKFRRTVAVKQIYITGRNTQEKKQNLSCAQSEVSALIAISTNRVAVPIIYDDYYDQNQSIYYIIMEWIDGDTLSAHMCDPEYKFIQWMIELCTILAIMSKRRIYHKDIKPDNIMIGKDEHLYLIDFNISVNTPNQIEGTVGYKAPEMKSGSKYSGREKVDMFSLGVILYQYYTGMIPIYGIDYASNRMQNNQEWSRYTEPKEKTPQIDPAMNELITICMKRNPKQRFYSYSDLVRELSKIKRRITWKKDKKTSF